MFALRRGVASAVAPISRVAYARAMSIAGSSGRKVGDVMTKNVTLLNASDTIMDAARKMRDQDIGFLPVQDNDRLVGMITDRDIAVRVAAEGKDPSATRVQSAMTRDVKYVFEDEPVDHVARNMAQQKVRRLPVMNREKRLVGVVALGDLATHGDAGLSGEALSSVSSPGGAHSQKSSSAGDQYMTF